MANENDEIYSGTRYLMDAKNSRQYAILFSHGAPSAAHAFAKDIRTGGFQPNEVIFALDDSDKRDNPVEIVNHPTLGPVVTTTLYQIKTNAAAEPKQVFFFEVTYQMSADPFTGTTRFEMTAESVRNLQVAGFHPGFPRTFAVFGMDQALTFPPHHDGIADIARQGTSGIDMTPRGQTSVQKPGPSFPPSRPTTDFNNRAPRRDIAAPPPPRVSYKVSDSVIEGLIKQYCRDFSELAAQGKLDPVIGRGPETEQSLKVLMRRKQSSLCFIGDAGVGKTAMFAAIAQRLHDGQNLPKTLQGARVLELDLQGMNAGAKFRGQFEEKLKPLIDGLQEREGVLKGRKIILAIDEIHSQLTAGKAEGGTDSGNLMKPFLTSKGISVMGTTTSEEYKKHIEKDGALGRRFEPVPLLPTSEEETNAIIKALMPLAVEHNNLTRGLTDDEIRYIVTMSNRYAPQEAQPSKAEKVMLTAAASAEFEGRDFISRQDILTAIAQMSKLPTDFLNQSDHDRFLKLETALPQEVLGQPGLMRVVDGLIGSRSGLTDPNQPWGCFVFQGPTGTGKTEACKALARYLFGTEDALIKLDMAEYSDKHTVSRLIGAPPGFVGFESAEPALTEKIRQRPFSILLLDEIEKAHPDVFNVLLPILNDGKMTDNQGKTVLFNNVIIVMTTNAGAVTVMNYLKGGSSIGFDTGAQVNTPEKTSDDLKKIYKKAVTESSEPGRPPLFRPEMINRIEELGGFITFLPLEPAVISKLVDRELDKVNKRLTNQDAVNLRDVTLEVSAAVREQLAKDGYDKANGARPMRKVVREKIQNPLGKWLMRNKETLAAFTAEHGPAKIVIDALPFVTPHLAKMDVPVPEASVANDNATAKKPPRAKTKKSQGPDQL